MYNKFFVTRLYTFLRALCIDLQNHCQNFLRYDITTYKHEQAKIFSCNLNRFLSTDTSCTQLWLSSDSKVAQHWLSTGSALSLLIFGKYARSGHVVSKKYNSSTIVGWYFVKVFSLHYSLLFSHQKPWKIKKHFHIPVYYRKKVW